VVGAVGVEAAEAAEVVQRRVSWEENKESPLKLDDPGPETIQCS
jgi:hypothetical protein